MALAHSCAPLAIHCRLRWRKLDSNLEIKRVRCWTIRNLYWLNPALSWEHLHSRHHPSTYAFYPLPLPRCQSQYHWKKKKYICHLSSQELTSLFLRLSWNFASKTFSFYFLDWSQSPIFFVRSSGSSAYRYGRPSWFHMSRGGGCRVYKGR